MKIFQIFIQKGKNRDKKLLTFSLNQSELSSERNVFTGNITEILPDKIKKVLQIFPETER